MESISGCQSGWTVYFDQSYIPPQTSLPVKNHDEHNRVNLEQSDQEEYEEDDEDDSLSMVSDASSGPPHLDLEEVGCLCTASSFPSNANAVLYDVNVKKKRKVDQFLENQQVFASTFDDTASSPIFTCYDSTTGVIEETETMPQSVAEFSCSFSATNLMMHSEKKMKGRYGDKFPSSSSKEQPVQEFL